ncbi:hypothetical protein BHM03_00054595, partial [Ensete ventricosum]
SNFQYDFIFVGHTTDVKVGDELLVDGGMVRFEVIEKIGPDVKCRCTDPGLLLPRANLTFWRDGSLVRERNAMLPTISSKVDCPLLGGSAKNRLSAVDFGRWRPIEEEIDRRRSIEEEKGKKKRKRKKKKEEKKEYLARLPLPPAGRLRAIAARGRGRFFSRARRQSVSPRGEKDRGDSRTGTNNISVHGTDR